jgi:hypothetical protein
MMNFDISSSAKEQTAESFSELSRVVEPNLSKIIHIRKGRILTTIVEKSGHELRLKLFSPESTEWQSRIDLDDPTRLMCPFVGIMTLALLWHPTPARVHVLGLGGGNLPLLLRRLFPDLEIDCTELEPEVYELALKYFSFRPDAKMHVIIGDGRKYLESRPTTDPYDLIFIDAFLGIGISPLRLGTQEFLIACKAQLSPGGMLVINLLPEDSLIERRLVTISSEFSNVFVYREGPELVLFAHNSEYADCDNLPEKAMRLQEHHNFNFPFYSMAQKIVRLAVDKSALATGGEPALLTDKTPPHMLQIHERYLKGIGRNDRCPCGSGLKFKKCHGGTFTCSGKEI